MRLIANVQMNENRAQKTFEFQNPSYLGDPLNIIRILNQKGAQEIVLTDLGASVSRNINYELIKFIADEVTVPFSYAGGISQNTDIKRLASLGVERFIINTSFFQSPTVVSELVRRLGSSSVSLSIDITGVEFSKMSKSFTFGGGKKNSELLFEEICDRTINLDIGEIIFRIVDLDGSDGEKTLEIYNNFFEVHKQEISKIGNRQILIGTGVRNRTVMEGLNSCLPIDGCVVGSLVSFAKKGNGVLVNFPKELSVL
jgi:cyclase